MSPFRILAATVCALAAFWPSIGSAQYGDAYHKPDYARLQQMRNQRMEEIARQNRGRSPGGGSAATVGSGAPGLSSSRNIWAVTDGFEKQQEAGRRYQAQVDRDAARWSKFEALAAQRQLQARPDFHAELIATAVEAGIDRYTAGRNFGETPAAYAEKLVEEGRLPKPSADGKRRHGWLTRTGGSDGSGPVYSGLWINGAPVGRHTTRMPSGQEVVTDHDDPTRSTVKFVSGNRFVGLLDGNNMGRGKLVYADGETFEGDFLDGRPHIGTWVKAGGSFTGEKRNRLPVRGRMNGGAFIFEGVFDAEGMPRSGQLTLPKEGRVLAGHFDKAFKRSGYAVNQLADGSHEELLLDNDRPAGPLIRTLASGDVFTGSAAAPDQPVLGMVQPRGGTPVAARLAADGSFVPVPAEQHAQAQALARQAAERLIPERVRLRQLIEQP
jgi:hypothetical protein